MFNQGGYYLHWIMYFECNFNDCHHIIYISLVTARYGRDSLIALCFKINLNKQFSSFDLSEE